MRAVTAVLILASCSGHASQPDVSVSNAFTPSEKMALRVVAQDWSDLTDQNVSLDGGPWRVVREQPPAGYVGWTYAGAHLVQLAPGQEPSGFAVAARHEFGHVLGLRHLVDPKSIMHPGADVATFSRCDVIDCMRVGACSHRFDFDPDDCPEEP